MNGQIMVPYQLHGTDPSSLDFGAGLELGNRAAGHGHAAELAAERDDIVVAHVVWPYFP